MPWPTRAACYLALGGQGALPERVGSSEGLGLADVSLAKFM